MSQIRLGVEGMHCEGCVSSVTKALARLEGVSAASADYSQGIADVTYDSEMIAVLQLKQAIEDAGFDISD